MNPNAMQVLRQCPHTGKTTYFEDIGNHYVIYTEQDVEPVMDFCHAKADDKPGAVLRHVAEVPLVFVDQAAVEGWLHDQQAWKRWLNDRDHFRFRSWGGRL